MSSCTAGTLTHMFGRTTLPKQPILGGRLSNRIGSSGLAFGWMCDPISSTDIIKQPLKKSLDAMCMVFRTQVVCTSQVLDQDTDEQDRVEHPEHVDDLPRNS